ncbi:hypothetical protein WKY82_01010 [Gordonia malaquae]|uniref:hypothetical protein n=1 Tax=Gordonia malaquae TaxID=410332 RepID=UPI0030C79549
MLFAVSGLLTALICAPLLGGHLIYRDAVAVPRFALTPSAFGIDGSAPRAVPQDAVLGVASRVVDGGWLVALLTAAALFGAGVGCGRLARRLVPSAGATGSAAAAVVAIWNPFVAERLLQGQWSLLIGYAALAPIVLSVLSCESGSGRREMSGCIALFAAAGFTPTGSVLALTVAVVVMVAVRLPRRRAAMILTGWLVTASPWLVGSVVSSASASSGGAGAFAVRAEPGLGSFGTALGLGGIWNADAVPVSRTSWWAAVATAAFLGVVIVGCAELLRRRTDPVVRALAMLAAGTVVVVSLAATGPGVDVMDAALAHVPGAGLLRDTQKYLALAVPFVAIAVAAAVARLRRLIPAGFAVSAVALLVIAPLPDLAWGVGGAIRPVAIPAEYATVTATIGSDDRTVALWPTATVRTLTWTNGPSLSPLPRMVDAPIVSGAGLVVDGDTFDAPTGRDADVIASLTAGDTARLAALGVGWVIVEESAPPPGLSPSDEMFHGEHLRLFRIPDAVPAPAPSAAAWTAAITATAAWFAALIVGAVVGLVEVVQRRVRKTSAKPSAASDHE